MKLSDLTGATRSATVTYNGNALDLVVNVSAITPKLATEANQMAQPTTDPKVAVQKIQLLSEMVCRVLSSWGLVGNDEQPYPLTPESVSELPIDFLTAVVVGAMSGQGEAPAPESGANSDATS